MSLANLFSFFLILFLTSEGYISFNYEVVPAMLCSTHSLSRDRTITNTTDAASNTLHITDNYIADQTKVKKVR